MEGDLAGDGAGSGKSLSASRQPVAADDEQARSKAERDALRERLTEAGILDMKAGQLREELSRLAPRVKGLAAHAKTSEKA